jgi:hypothetical protein
MDRQDCPNSIDNLPRNLYTILDLTKTGGDVVQKCTTLVPKIAESLHVVHICTTFGEILGNRYKCSAKMHHLASMPV